MVQIVMKIKDLQKIELPREKLEKYGSSKLADYELLAVLLGSGIEGVNVLELSKKIILLINKIGIKKITFDDLQEIKGLGPAKALQIIAILELGKRFNTEKIVEVLSPEDVWKLCADIRESKKEHFAVFYLNTQNQLIERQIISIGTLNASLVHPREVFEPAVALHAASVIVSHNHPSGTTEPSQDDIAVTKRLVEAGNLMGIEVLDHIIVSHNAFMSFKQEGII